MSAENLTPRPADDFGNDLDVPDFMKSDAPTVEFHKPHLTVLKGEIISPRTAPEMDADNGPDDTADDIAPGAVEYYTRRPPVLYRGGSAAMTAARHTGRRLGAGARYFGHGLKHTTILGYRYVRAHDHRETIGGMASGTDWNKVHTTRHARWKFLRRAVAGLGLADLIGWWGLTAGAGLAAADSWAILPGAELVGAVTAITAYGRYRLNRQLAPGQLVDAADIDDGEEPYPLAWCKNPEQVADCVSRALAAEGVSTRSVRLLGARTWGYEVDVVLKGSTPGKVNAVADQLDAHFNIKQGGTLIDPDPREAAHLVLRLVTANPFENMPKPQVHAPNSLDIADEHNFGWCMDGAPLNLVLEGTRILVIGVSGAAKSTGVLRDLAEVITACHNAIAIEMDPVKDGLREFEGVMAVPPIRGREECEGWLEYLVAMAEARNVVRNRLNMGDTWEATGEHPAIFPIVDEFIYLSQPAKENFIKLLRLGRQTGIYPIAAGQDATSDSLGDAIADSFTLGIMLASREEDIRLVFGSGAKNSGFRPDRLQPAQNKHIKNDAGQSYIKGAGLTRPLLYGWNELDRQQIKRAVADRAEAGRPWFDHDTLAEAGLLHLATEYGPQATGETLTVADRLEMIGTPDARTVALLLRLFDQDGVDFLPTAAIVDAGIATDGAELQALLVRLVPMAKSAKVYVGGKQARGWERRVVDQAAAALFAPSCPPA